MITTTGGYNKYVGKIDAQKQVIVYANIHRNGKLATKNTRIHNSKLVDSKHNEENTIDQKRNVKQAL